MRYQLTSDNPIEEAVLNSQQMVRSLFDPLLPVIQARCIMAAAKLRVFETIGKGSRTVDELAERLAINAETLHLLLRVLSSAGYVAGDGEKWHLTEITQQTLLQESPMQLTSWAEHNYLHWKIISQLERVLETGECLSPFYGLDTDSEWLVYQRAMYETARPAAAWVAEQIPIQNGAEKMLDIGGSHGLYSAAICRKHPPMKSEVIDLPEAIEHASEIGREAGIEDVVTYRVGDALVDDLPRISIEAAFLGNIVHHFTVEQIHELFLRLNAALSTGGTIAIWDFKRPDQTDRPDIVSDGLALMFHISSASRCYTEGELIEWLRQADFSDIRSHPTPAPSQLLLTGRVS